MTQPKRPPYVIQYLLEGGHKFTEPFDDKEKRDIEFANRWKRWERYKENVALGHSDAFTQPFIDVSGRGHHLTIDLSKLVAIKKWDDDLLPGMSEHDALGLNV